MENAPIDWSFGCVSVFTRERLYGPGSIPDGEIFKCLFKEAVKNSSKIVSARDLMSFKN